MGPLQTASRSLMARLSPPDRLSEFFGLLAFSNRATAFTAQLAVALATQMLGDQRLGISVLLVFLLPGPLADAEGGGAPAFVNSAPLLVEPASREPLGGWPSRPPFQGRLRLATGWAGEDAHPPRKALPVNLPLLR